jgi:hypothetical protein
VVGRARRRATRIFDLRMGPVLALLGNQLALHELSTSL